MFSFGPLEIGSDVASPGTEVYGVRQPGHGDGNFERKDLADVDVNLGARGVSLIGILAGFVVVYGLFKGNRMDGWTAVFLAITALTSLTGFFFPFHKLLPSHILGVLSLIVLAIAVPARYVYHLAGGWRRIYVITAVLALYFNFFVLIAQLFQKVPPLKALAPTQSEPPFLVAQTCALVLFIILGIYSVKGFRGEQLQHAA